MNNKEERFVFVGERPSRTAVRRGWTWKHGRLAGKTLHDALARIGIDPAKQKYVNLFGDGCERDAESIEINERILLIRRLNRRGYKVIGMGQRVCQRLREAEVVHLSIRHPAARGRLRRRELYTAHVRQSLAGDLK
ncbi:MAG: hypothetical protein ACR2LZ_12695 [Pyrinomonadaceae bacterium]